jgi:hypothetical protein
MKWLACVVLLAGCLRARATVVHPTELSRSNPTGPGTSIARASSESPQDLDAETPGTLGSIELGVLVPFRSNRNSARVHIAPGIRILNSDAENVLAGVAIGADFVNRFALEGSVYFGDGGGGDPTVIDQVMDLFAGVTMDARSTSIAIGPSVGLLSMPGGSSIVMFGLGVRVTGARE